MVSERKLRANRANARVSTGPRTAAGKARAARNARQHGLSLSVLSEPARAGELNTLAKTIAGECSTPDLQNLAVAVVAAQVDLVRVRKARNLVLSRAMNEASLVGLRVESEFRSTKRHPITLAEVARKLIALDRYERRTLSRRKFAIRAFDTAQANRASS